MKEILLRNLNSERKTKIGDRKSSIADKEMQGQIRSLTDQNQTYTAKHKAFVNSFHDLLNHKSA